MKKHRLFRSSRFLLLVPILVALLLVVGGGPSGLHAQEDEEASTWIFNDFACWTSGPISSPAAQASLADWDFQPALWGKDDDDFVADRRDLGDDARFTSGVGAQALGGDHQLVDDNPGVPVYTLFHTFPELVEYSFALDVFDDSNTSDRKILDRRVRILANKFGLSDKYPIGEGDWGPDEDRRMLLPWESKEEYLKRRTVGIFNPVGIKSYSAEWIDPANPGGGRDLDDVALSRDQMSNYLEATEATSAMAGDGGVVHYGTSEGIAQQVLYQTITTCGGDGVCTDTSNYSNVPVPLTLHNNSREQNDGQIERNTTGEDSRAILKVVDKDADGNPVTTVVESRVDLRETPVSSQMERDAMGSGYSRMHQENTGRDEIRVTLTLGDKFRGDFDYDPDPGKLYSSRGLPAMGFEPWTYDLIGEYGFRDPEVNEWVRGGATLHPEGGVTYQGYRQPRLNVPQEFYGGSDSLTGDNVDHLRWPVNLEDLNWYLYELPTGGYRKPMWLYLVSRWGVRELVHSAYGSGGPLPIPADGDIDGVEDENQRDRLPRCSTPGGLRDEVTGEVHKYLTTEDIRPPLNLRKIDCGDWDVTSSTARHLLLGDAVSDAHLPFYAKGVTDGKYLLGPDFLVKQGVESAIDAHGPLGSRKMSRFEFSILETQPMGEGPPAERGYEAERRYGIPRDDTPRHGSPHGPRTEYLQEWKSEPIDPNLPHLLVFTFYEAKDDGDVEFRYTSEPSENFLKRQWDREVDSVKDTLNVFIPDEFEFDQPVFELPKRQIRRVVCRAMVYPSGVTSTVGRSGSLWDDALSGVTDFVGEQFRVLGGWLAKILSSIAQLPLHVGVKTTELACSGLGKLDDLTSLDDVSGPAPPVLIDEEGRLRVNAATASKREGSQRCHRISSPVVSTCERDTDMIVQGECTRLPELRLSVRAAEFIRPPEAVEAVGDVEAVEGGVPYREYQLLVPPDSYFQEHGERDFVAVVNAVAEGEGFAPPMFDPVVDLSAEDPPKLTNRNRGLTRAYVDWDFRWDVVSPDVYDRIDGFAVFLHPDQKSVPYVAPEQGFDFYLPKWVFAKVEVLGGDVLSSHHQIDEFSVGGLTYYPPRVPLVVPGSLQKGPTAWFILRLMNTARSLKSSARRRSRDTTIVSII